ncbi:MAG: hypothetical protein GKR91_06585 [Pseudomonadales bacterium]|nr:hypothetical protein [Pseudomonadales bacterium]
MTLNIPRLLSYLLVAVITVSVVAQDDSPYEREYPVMNYGTASLHDAITTLQTRIDRGEINLEFNPERGYLDSTLKALNISTTSQLLVFSRTSLQQPLISPQAPRAIYFNDNVYVAWVQESGLLEVASMDPNLGPVFFTLSQVDTEQPRFNREFRLCLRCHDSLSLTGGGTPRFMMSSNYTGTAGQLVSHEGSIMTTSRTPIRNRWGGWYVSGFHGEQRHLGNVLIETADDISDENLARMGNQETLVELTDTDPYILPYSDIVALLVIEHQIEVQNKIARTNFYARTLFSEEELDATEVEQALDVLSEELVQSLFMVGQPALTGSIEGTSGFAESFMAAGPIDSQGRSLRDLDLQQRLFTYPLSYLIYSDAYRALPEQIKNRVRSTMEEILSGSSNDEAYTHLSDQDRQAISEILAETGWNN